MEKYTYEWKIRFLRYAIALIGVALMSCADSGDRAAVQIEPANDQKLMGQFEVLTCDQIEMEYTANTDMAAQKTGLDNGNNVQDIMDRNFWLRKLALVKDCNTSSYPAQPALHN